MPYNAEDALEIINDELNTNINLKGVSYSRDTLEDTYDEEEKDKSYYNLFKDRINKRLSKAKKDWSDNNDYMSK